MTAQDCYDQAMAYFDAAERFAQNRDPKIRRKAEDAEQAARALRDQFVQLITQPNQQPTQNQ